MRIDPQLSDDLILRELGTRITSARVGHNLTQADLAEKAGVSKRTVERLESGEVATQLSGFLRVCRALGLVDRFDALVAEAGPSPMDQLKLQGRKRQRASRKKPPVGHAPKKWTWGESS